MRTPMEFRARARLALVLRQMRRDTPLLWSGTAESVVDLHPEGFVYSVANAVSGATQVGYGGLPTGQLDNALLWSGTAESVVDLNPVGIDFSTAEGISGTRQVGRGSGPATGGNMHALVWSGTAESAVDLHRYLTGLGPDFVRSYAWDITDDGSIVGEAWANSTQYAILWTPVPEPTAATILLCGIGGLTAGRRRIKTSR